VTKCQTSYDEKMIVGVAVDAHPGERRVPMVPSAVRLLDKVGLELVLECGTGASAGFTDAEY
jgi:NAD(P) transhydrogenase subunit alpha